VASRRRWAWVVGVAALGLLIAGGAATWALAGRDKNSASPSSTQTSPQTAVVHKAAECPVHQQNPGSQPPAHEGDDVAFVDDVTLPDCTHVARGQSVQKVWRFRNTGALTWRGYALQRVDLPQTRDQCQTVPEAPIRETPPGQVVDVRVDVTTPNVATFCFVRFKIVDATGAVAFPGNRPVNFQVVVD
jgi:Ig-like domain from next to BRCA1 gene